MVGKACRGLSVWGFCIDLERRCRCLVVEMYRSDEPRAEGSIAGWENCVKGMAGLVACCSARDAAHYHHLVALHHSNQS